MNRLLSPRPLFLLALALLIAANGVVLLHVATNRRGEPESRLIVSERELALPSFSHAENSGLSLRLNWQVLGVDEASPYPNRWSAPTWLDEAKMRQLGFPVDQFLARSAERKGHDLTMNREVFVVLELDGEAYQAAIRRAEKKVAEAETVLPDRPAADYNSAKNAQQRLNRLRAGDSRLFAIDAGLDPLPLRQQYSDRSRFLLVSGLIAPSVSSDKKTRRVSGRIERLLIERIHVPLEHRPILDALAATRPGDLERGKAPRYQIELAVGSRFEPWIVTVHRLQAND